MTREIEESFLGLAFKLHPQPDQKDAKRDLEYAMVVHDGTGVVESETFTTQVTTAGKGEEVLKDEVKRVSREVLGKVRQYEENRRVKVSVALTEKKRVLIDRYVWLLWPSHFQKSWLRMKVSKHLPRSGYTWMLSRKSHLVSFAHGA